MANHPLARPLRVASLLALTLLPSACSGGGAFTPEPAGVLLQGDPGSPALAALVDLAPSAAPAAEIVDGLLSTRLEALLAPTASVGEVNQALAGIGAGISSMNADSPVVTLVVPQVADAAAAAALAQQLAAQPAFAAVTACFTGTPGPALAQVGGPGFAGASPSGAIGLVSSHLDAIRMTAAKNAAGMLLGEEVPVLVPDTYALATPHPMMITQSMLAGAGGIESDPELGNRGFTTCGILATDPEFDDYDAVHPDPLGNLALLSLPLSGLTWSERVHEILRHVPAGRFVLNTGQAYEQDFDQRTKLWRMLDALTWRVHAPAPDTFVHLTAAGDSGGEPGQLGQAAWASPFALSERFPSLADLAAQELSEADQQHFLDVMLVTFGGEPPPLGNLRVVGSSHPISHARSAFSASGEDLRVVGEDVHALCLVEGANCSADGTLVTSTFAATAQVSGIAAWCWSLAPERSVAELLEILDRAWFAGGTPGLVDAYFATLALDLSLFDPRVRMEILDVAAESDVQHPLGNGQLDHHDLKVFVDGLAAGTNLRFDLNGDGHVGGPGRALFDLDVDSPPSIETVSLFVEGELHDYDESALTDLEVLCYYAYSSLYVGDTDARAILLADCHDAPDSDVLLEYGFRSAMAVAGAGESNVSQSWDGVEGFDEASFVFQNSASGLDDDSPASASSSVSFLSSFETDVLGNFIRFSAGGSGAGEFTMDDPGPGAHSTGGVGLVDGWIMFHVHGEPVPFTLQLDIDGAWSGDPALGEFGQVRVFVKLYDGAEQQFVIDELLASPDTTFPASFTYSGELQATTGLFAHSLTFQVKAAGEAGFSTGGAPPQISADGSCTWSLELQLDP